MLERPLLAVLCRSWPLSVLVKSDAIGGQVECKGGHVKCNFASGGSEQKLQAV
jgi:hypothetical protein